MSEADRMDHQQLEAWWELSLWPCAVRSPSFCLRTARSLRGSPDINRLNTSESHSTSLSKPKPRIAILSVTEDASSQYVPIMNCIFSAQKSVRCLRAITAQAPRLTLSASQNIPIDVCKIYGADAVFLQQACHLTSGSYYKIERRAGLLQYLMVRSLPHPFPTRPTPSQMAFLAGPSARRHLTQPTQEQVDLRAACFCHRKIIDIGYVCSVCLSSLSPPASYVSTLTPPCAVFCSPLPVCSTCRFAPHSSSPFAHTLTEPSRRTKFPMATLKRLGFGAKPANGAGGAGTKKRKAGPGTPGPGTPRTGSPAPTRPAT